jgi:hypothetical protein
MLDTLGRAAIRFAWAYVRHRYRREIRISAGIAVVAAGVGLYLFSRNPTEG